MKYKRNRTQSLTVRLTNEEKELIKRKAAEKKMTVTDYLLTAALKQDDTLQFKPILHKLSEIQRQLNSLKKQAEPIQLSDALDLQKQIYDEVLNAVRKT